jgi:hypothetical protein
MWINNRSPEMRKRFEITQQPTVMMVNQTKHFSVHLFYKNCIPYFSPLKLKGNDIGLMDVCAYLSVSVSQSVSMSADPTEYIFVKHQQFSTKLHVVIVEYDLHIALQKTHRYRSNVKVSAKTRKSR